VTAPSRPPAPPPDLASIEASLAIHAEHYAAGRQADGEEVGGEILAAIRSLVARPPPPDREARIALMRALVDVAQIHGASGEGYSIPLNEAESALLSAFDALAGELTKARERFHAEDRAWVVSAPHGDPAECPTYYDGCHCTVGTLAFNIARAESAERALGEARRTLTEWAEADDDAGPLDDPRSPQGIRLRIAKERLHSLAAASPGTTVADPLALAQGIDEHIARTGAAPMMVPGTTTGAALPDARGYPLPKALACGHDPGSQRVVVSRECVCGDSEAVDITPAPSSPGSATDPEAT
jgi:hypothetical protein